jgi:phosphoribosylformylglycinamidine cyclo-ligase
VATIVNDLITCGALPISVAMHAAVGDSGWFADAVRMKALVDGWAEGCHRPGRSGAAARRRPQGHRQPEAIVLAGSAIGKIAPKAAAHHRRRAGRRRDHLPRLVPACRPTALPLPAHRRRKLPQKYQTPIGHGDQPDLWRGPARAVGDLRGVRARVPAAGVKLNYVAHVTGHGWRKLMRLEEPFVYEITEPRAAPACSSF